MSTFRPTGLDDIDDSAAARPLITHQFRANKTMQKITTTYMAAGAFLPLPILEVLVALNKFGIAGPRDPTNHGTDKRSHRYIILASGSALSFGASYRCVVTYFLRPRLESGWWTGAASYYSLNFLPVLFLIIPSGVTEVDQKLWLPKNYTGPEEEVKEFPRRELTGMDFSSLSDATSVNSVELRLKRLTTDEAEADRILNGTRAESRDEKARSSVENPLGIPPRRNGRY